MVINDTLLEKPLFEMCWFYMKGANVEKKVLQTILASPYTLGQMWEKVLQTILARQGASLTID